MNRQDLKWHELLLRGEANALHMRELSARLGVNCRQCRALVTAARAKGIPILSGDNGYFLPETDEEAETFVRIWESRARVVRAAIRAARRWRDGAK